ncbi:MAG: GAF domain-containing protein [Anaerolineales bacterium]
MLEKQYRFKEIGRNAPKMLLASEEEILVWREQLVRNTLRVVVLIGALAVIAGSYYANEAGSSWIIPFYLTAYLGLVVVTIWKRIPYPIQAGSLVGLVYFLGVLDLLEFGRGGDGRVFLLTVPLLAVLFFGKIEGLIALALDAFTLGIFAWLYASQRIVISISRQANFADPFAWLSNIIVLLMLGTFLVTCLNYLVPRLTASLARTRRLLQRLDETHKELREHTEEMTRSHRLLAERTKALELTADLARDAASVQDLPELLNRVVNLISERFDYYHAGIFLVDSTGKWAELRAASSEGGKKMLEKGHKLPIGRVGIVGFVAGEGKSRIAFDVGGDPVFFDNPDLPDTRSEMALPLRVRKEIIGVLDVQSVQSEAFSKDDLAILQVIADQLAMVISNIRLFNQARASLEAERRAYDKISQKAWNEVLHTNPDFGYRFSGGVVTQLSENGKGKVSALESETNQQPTSELPIRIRGQVIGYLAASKSSHTRAWTEAETELLNTLVDQMSLALDSARLFRDAQQRARRERLVTEISTKLRASNDQETIIQTAIDELRQALATGQVDIAFHPDAVNLKNPSNGSSPGKDN